MDAEHHACTQRPLCRQCQRWANVSEALARRRLEPGDDIDALVETPTHAPSNGSYSSEATPDRIRRKGGGFGLGFESPVRASKTKTVGERQETR